MTKESVLEEFKDVFTGLGKHKHIEAEFIIDKSVTPVLQKPRKIPYNLLKPAMAEEDRLLKLGVIEKVPDDIPSEWCVNPSIQLKPMREGETERRVRYWSNMRLPNTAIKRPIKEAMTLEDVKVEVAGSKYFSTLDMNDAYHQLALNKSSRGLTMFYGTRERLWWKRLNYGASASQDIFDRAMDETIVGLPGVLHIRDDFVVQF